MTRLCSPRRRQRGVALIATLAVVILGVAWFLVAHLDMLSGDFTAARRNHNAAVLAEAKQALIGYLAMRAADTMESEPGALPCPEPAGNAGGASEGSAAGTLTLPAVGRLPWKTLGIDQLRDASGEPLWYALADGWGKCGTTETVINSNCASSSTDLCWTGQLTVGGQARAAVALIMAPGTAMTGQTRSAPAAGIDPANYVECYNTAAVPGAFSIPACSSNDHVIAITASDLLPAIEAAVADRFERQIAPQLRTAYSSASWGATTTLPFALTFTDPAAATSYAPGVTHGAQGILPLSYSETSPNSGTSCTPSAADPRCQPLFVAWTGGTLSGASIYSSSCTVVTGTTTRLDCTFYYTCALLLCAPPPLNYTIQAQATNVGASLRQINLSAPITGSVTSASITSATGALDAAGSATLTLTGTLTPDGSGGFLSAVLGNTLCGLPLVSPILGCKPTVISVPIGVLADHPLVDVNNATYGWFVRNKWHEVAYYAVAPGIAPGGGGSCTTSATCLSLSYHPSDGKQRGLVVLSGRSLSGTPRPNGTLADWLEGANVDGTSPFAVRDPALTINRSFNDRFAVIDSN